MTSSVAMLCQEHDSSQEAFVTEYHMTMSTNFSVDKAVTQKFQR